MFMLFDRIGEKMKTLATVITIIGISGTVLAGCALIIDYKAVLLGIVVIVVGILVSWISSWTLYGFGEIIEKLCEIAENTRNNSKEARPPEITPVKF